MQSEIIKKLEAHIISECSQVDTDKAYDEMLDEVTDCCTLCKQYGAARILKEVDPTAYRCGKVDWLDSCRDQYVEVNGNDYDTREVEGEKAKFIEDHESEITDLENEIEEMEADEDHNVMELASKQRKLAELEAELKELNQHSF